MTLIEYSLIPADAGGVSPSIFPNHRGVCMNWAKKFEMEKKEILYFFKKYSLTGEGDSQKKKKEGAEKERESKFRKLNRVNLTKGHQQAS